MTINLPLPDISVRYLPEIPPAAPVRRKARRYTLAPPVVVAADPGQPPDPDRCTCDPKRWRNVPADRIRHEPTCPRSKSPR